MDCPCPIYLQQICSAHGEALCEICPGQIYIPQIGLAQISQIQTSSRQIGLTQRSRIPEYGVTRIVLSLISHDFKYFYWGSRLAELLNDREFCYLFDGIYNSSMK